MNHLRKRIERLETSDAPAAAYPFLWGRGVPLTEALAGAGLSLDDKPLLAIRLVGYERGENGPVEIPDPVHERDKHLLD